MEVDNQLKEGTKLIQQKGIPIPIHLQPAVKKGFKKLKKHGHIGVAKIFAENCFMRHTVITMQKDKSANSLATHEIQTRRQLLSTEMFSDIITGSIPRPRVCQADALPTAPR